MKSDKIYKTWSDVVSEVFKNKDSIWYKAMSNGDELRVFINIKGECRISKDDISSEDWKEIIL